jgi:hypothetical protein
LRMLWDERQKAREQQAQSIAIGFLVRCRCLQSTHEMGVVLTRL